MANSQEKTNNLLREQINLTEKLVDVMQKVSSNDEDSLKKAVIRSQTVNDTSKHYLNIKNTLSETAKLDAKILENVQKKEKLETYLSKLGHGNVYFYKERAKAEKDIGKYSKKIESLEKEKAITEELDSFLQKNIKNQTLVSYLQSGQNSKAEMTGVHMRALLGTVVEIFNTFNELDNIVTSVRQTFGMLPEEGRYLHKTILDSTIELSHLGATLEDVGNATTALGKSFTGIVGENGTLLETTVMLNKSFGISNDIAIKFSKTLAGISGTSVESRQNIAGFAKNIAAAGKIPLDKLMSEVADASDDARMFVGDSAVEMVKVAAQAKMLGTNLNDAATTAKSLLNFESSINSELKASALLGRQINLNNARRMAFNKNIIGANKEILRLTKEVGFNQLNPLQQEAYATATGKSVTELQSMLQQEKNLELVRLSGDAKSLERYYRYKDMLKLSEENAENEGEIARNEMLRLNNQTRMSALQSQFNQLILQLQEPFLDFAELVMHLAVKGMPLLIAGFRGLGVITGLYKIVGMFQNASGFLGKISNLIIGIVKSIQNSKIIFTITSWFGKIMGFIKNLGPAMKPIVKLLSFAKFIPGLGQIITGLTFLSSLVRNIQDGKGWDSLRIAAKDALVQPFIDAYYLIKPWLGFSPSEIGLSIVKGISSIRSLLFDVIISPWVMAYNWIQSSFIGKLLPGGTIKIPSLGIGGEDVSDSGSSSNATSALNDIKASNEMVVNKIDELITLMASGGIVINLDGTKVNQALATSAYTRGSRGSAVLS